jgi:hypothetical protein
MLTIEDKNRWIEIEFYYMIQQTLQEYKHSVFVYDIIESACSLLEVNITLIKSLLGSIIQQECILAPSKEELCILWQRQGRSIRKLRKYSQIHPETYYRYTTQPDADDLHFNPKLNQNQTEEIKKFLTGTRRLSKIWQKA